MNNILFKDKEIKQYMLYLVDHKKMLIDEDVGQELENALLWIANHPESSISKYHQYINGDDKSKEDKAVRFDKVKTIIIKLDDLGLIRKVIDKNERYQVSIENNGEILYSVTSLGLFYILNKDLVNSVKDVLLKNRNDTFFRAFLFPYIELDTLEKLEGSDTFLALSKYLVTCARIVNTVVRDHLLKVENNNGQRNMVGFPRSSLIPEAEDPFDYGPYSSIAYLKNRFKIPWLDETNIKIRDEITKDNNKIIRISNEKGSEELILKIYPETKKAKLLDNSNNHEIANFDLEKHLFKDNSYIMWDILPVTVRGYLDTLFSNKLFYFYHDMEYAVNKLGYDILQYIHYDNYLPDNEFNERQGDRNILENDHKFRKLANNGKGSFDRYMYHELELNPLPITS